MFTELKKRHYKILVESELSIAVFFFLCPNLLHHGLKIQTKKIKLLISLQQKIDQQLRITGFFE